MIFIKRFIYLLRRGAYIPTEYYINSSKCAVYIPIPKVACTSVKEAFFEVSYSPDEDLNYMDIHRRLASAAVHSLNAEQKKYFKFAFVRNPYDRLVSCYKDKVRKELQHNGRYYFDTRYGRWLLKGLSGIKFSPAMSFRQFVIAVSRIPDLFSDGHFRSQYHYLYKNSAWAPDYICRFEEAEKDWKIVRERFDLPALKRRNSTGNIDLSDWYNDLELVELVKKRYKNDIELWYQYEYETLRGMVGSK